MDLPLADVDQAKLEDVDEVLVLHEELECSRVDSEELGEEVEGGCQQHRLDAMDLHVEIDRGGSVRAFDGVLLCLHLQLFKTTTLLSKHGAQECFHDGQAGSHELIQVLWLLDGEEKWLQFCCMQSIQEAYQQLQGLGREDVLLEVGFFVDAIQHVEQEIEATFAEELPLELDSGKSFLLLCLSLGSGNLWLANDAGIAHLRTSSSLSSRLATGELSQASKHVECLVEIAVWLPLQHALPFLHVGLCCLSSCCAGWLSLQ